MGIAGDRLGMEPASDLKFPYSLGRENDQEAEPDGEAIWKHVGLWRGWEIKARIHPLELSVR
jgi:hypothetical protein